MIQNDVHYHWSKKHQRKQRQTMQAGIIERAMPLEVSNVMLLSPSDGKPTRVGYRFTPDGEKVRTYLERWALMTPQWSEHMLRFFKEPTSRSYIFTYSAGRELCRSYAAGEPERFRRLLTDQVRIRDLLATRATTSTAATSPTVLHGIPPG